MEYSITVRITRNKTFHKPTNAPKRYPPLAEVDPDLSGDGGGLAIILFRSSTQKLTTSAHWAPPSGGQSPRHFLNFVVKGKWDHSMILSVSRQYNL